MNRPPREVIIYLSISLALVLGGGIVGALEGNPELSGGATTVHDTSRDAFARPAANLPTAKLREFAFGNRLFNTKWAAPPASVKTLDGLGPLFNRNSCSGCHFKDGRGRPPGGPDEEMLSMLVRISLPGVDSHGAPLAHPVYGGQINPQSLQGIKPEGRVGITYTEKPGAYADGETYSLRVPQYHFTDFQYGELEDTVLFSPRVAPAVYGLGLVEAIPETAILRNEDPDDADGNGISGRANRVFDIASAGIKLGRFGWKAGQPNLRQQSAGAFVGDIGITSTLFPEENFSEVQAAQGVAVSGGEPEIEDGFLRKLVFYVQTLAVPARREITEPAVVRGEEVFHELDCSSCHQPAFVTGEHPEVPELSNQAIFPYSDFLLHDMGPELADGRPEFAATGNEWRTPPLWGIGLIETVNGHTEFLHDGRARGYAEAILWHGGEAEPSREKFRRLESEERESLIAFLKSL